MQTVVTNNTLTSFKVKNEDFFIVHKKEKYPKTYIETDEEWTWETLDFWPEWIDPQELLLVHKELKNG